MAKKNKVPSTPFMSEQISGFLNFLTQSERDLAWNQRELDRLDKLTQDYLHKLELGNLSYDEKRKIGPQLEKIRKQRREHKDSIEVLKPIIEFLNTEIGRKSRNMLNERLGQVRKVEKSLGERMYYFRVLQEPPIQGILLKKIKQFYNLTT